MGERARAVMFKSDFHRDTNRRNEAKLGSNFPGGLYMDTSNSPNTIVRYHLSGSGIFL